MCYVTRCGYLNIYAFPPFLNFLGWAILSSVFYARGRLAGGYHYGTGRTGRGRDMLAIKWGIECTT